MKKLSVIIAGAVLLFGTVTSVFAADTNIAVVNVAQILQSSAKVKAVNKQIQSKFSPQQKRLAAQDKAIQAESEKMSRNGAVMSAADKKKLQEKITKDKQDFVKDAAMFQQQLSQARDKAMQKIVKGLNDTISSVATSKGYTLVFFSQAVAYAGKTADITSAVEAAFNKS